MEDKKEATYTEILLLAHTEVLKLHGSIYKFINSEDVQKNFKEYTKTSLKNYLSIPKKGNKKTISYTFIIKLCKSLNIKIHHTRETTIINTLYI